MNTKLKQVWENAYIVLIAFLIASVVQIKLFALTEVNMESMTNTLLPGETLIMNKLAYDFSKPQRDDIIIFLKDESIDSIKESASIYLNDIERLITKNPRRNRLIKRIIGLPGDKIEIKNNVLYVNGIKKNESYAKIDPMCNTVLNGEYLEIKVKPNQYFVLGDNRGGSLDSRAFGTIDESWIEGKAVFRLFPFNKFGSIYKEE